MESHELLEEGLLVIDILTETAPNLATDAFDPRRGPPQRQTGGCLLHRGKVIWPEGGHGVLEAETSVLEFGSTFFWREVKCCFEESEKSLQPLE